MDTTKPVNRFLARFDVSFSLLIVIHVVVQVSCFSKNLQCVRGEMSLVKKSVATPQFLSGLWADAIPQPGGEKTTRCLECSRIRDLVSENGETILGTPKSSLVNYDQWENQWFGIAILYMGMDQYLLIPFLVGWTSIYQLFWCSPGIQGFDTLPYFNKPPLTVSNSRSWSLRDVVVLGNIDHIGVDWNVSEQCSKALMMWDYSQLSNIINILGIMNQYILVNSVQNPCR